MNKPLRKRHLGFKDIYENLKAQIERGAYQTDQRLPSSRALSLELGVARGTVITAYEQLTAEGYIVAKPGSRPTVILRKEVPAQPRTNPRRQNLNISTYAEAISSMLLPAPRSHFQIADFRYGDLSASDFPLNAWKKAMTHSRGDLSRYNSAQGSLRLRNALQSYLWRARGMSCSHEQIVIVNGSQQGLDLCARLLLNKTDTFAVENPCYLMARNVFASTGAKAKSIDIDQHGIITKDLKGIKAKLAYVTPSHQFPLGGVLPVARRTELISWANSQDAYIIEDDYDGEYRYDIKPIPPLFALKENASVIYLGTISKTLSPTLRLGYLVLPEELVELFVKAKLFTDRHAPLAEQEALATLIENGAYERHVRRARRNNGKRRAALLQSLAKHFSDEVTIEGENAGLHLVVWLNNVPRSKENEFIKAASERGVGIYPVSPLFSKDSKNSPKRMGLVMGYASLTIKQIEKGVEALSSISI